MNEAIISFLVIIILSASIAGCVILHDVKRMNARRLAEFDLAEIVSGIKLTKDHDNYGKLAIQRDLTLGLSYLVEFIHLYRLDDRMTIPLEVILSEVIKPLEALMVSLSSIPNHGEDSISDTYLKVIEHHNTLGISPLSVIDILTIIVEHYPNDLIDRCSIIRMQIDNN